MAKTPTRRRRPPVDRKRQKRAIKRVGRGRTAAAAAVRPEPEILTLAKIAALREEVAKLRGERITTRSGIVTTERGASGTQNQYGRIVAEDYNPLFEPSSALRIYDQMERSDAQCGAAVDLIRLPIRSAEFRAVPPQDATQKEKQIADTVNELLFSDEYKTDSWSDSLNHLLMRVHMGFSFVEQVWTFDEDLGLLRWQRLAPRLPRTVELFNPNDDGTLRSITQRAWKPGTSQEQAFEIPAPYLCLTTRNKEGDNFYGRSVLRRAYKHWWYKDEAYRIDGVRLDRYGVGIPVAKIEEGHVLEEDELTEIENTLIALRSHDRAYIIEPPKVSFRILMPDGQHGGATGLMESVKHHDGMILRAVLATFMADYAEGLNTNRTATLMDAFDFALRSEAGGIAADVKNQLVRPFCDYNFDMSDARYPTIEIQGLGDLTVGQLSEALPKFATGQLITPTDDVENMIRKVLDLQPLPKGWERGEKKPDPVQVAPGGDGNQQPPTPLSELAALAQSFGERQPQAITLNVQPPPDREPPPEPGPRTRIVHRDPTTGLVTAIVDSADTVELYAGQPRQTGGRFGHGKKDPGTLARARRSTAESRASNSMTEAEVKDTKFQAILSDVKAAADDPDASDFERANPVVVARGQREAQRWFDEVHPEGSQAYYKDKDGRYTADRQKVHEEILAHYEAQHGPPQERPIAIVTGGLPGAGKSVGLRQTVPDLNQFVNVNSDDVKGMLPEFNGANAGWLHEESDQVAAIAFGRAIKGRQNVILDVTMKSPGANVANVGDGLQGRILALKEAGYEVRMQYTDVSLKTSADRALKRYVKEGRFVPPTYIRTARRGTSTKNRETFEALKPLADSWRHFDNNGAQLQEVARSDK